MWTVDFSPMAAVCPGTAIRKRLASPKRRPNVAVRSDTCAEPEPSLRTEESYIASRLSADTPWNDVFNPYDRENLVIEFTYFRVTPSIPVHLELSRADRNVTYKRLCLDCALLCFGHFMGLPTGRSS